MGMLTEIRTGILQNRDERALEFKVFYWIKQLLNFLTKVGEIAT